MLKKEEKDRIKTLISDTVTLLCKNGLNYKAEFSIDAVIGISLDQSEEFFLSIKEMVKTPQAESPAPQSQVDFVEHVRSPIQRSTPAPKRRKRSMLENIKKEANIEGNGVDVDSSNSPLVKADGSQSRADVLPNLSLRDMQENASEYWSSVTGGEEEQGSEDEEETSKHPPAKRHRDGSSSQDSISGQSRPSNSENRTVVVKIKDEPGEEDYEEVDDDLEMAVQGQDSSMNSSLSHDTSGWSQYGSPMAGNKPQQKWPEVGQLPSSNHQVKQELTFPFEGNPMDRQFTMGYVNPPVQHHMTPQWLQTLDKAFSAGISSDRFSSSGFAFQPRYRSNPTKDMPQEDIVARRILHFKGSCVVPRAIQMGFLGKVKNAEILTQMHRLTGLGLGTMNVSGKNMFIKVKPDEVDEDNLAKFKMLKTDYITAYNDIPAESFRKLIYNTANTSTHLDMGSFMQNN